MSKNVFDSPEFAKLYASGKLGDMVEGGKIPIRMNCIYELLKNYTSSITSVLDIACATANFRKNLVEWDMDAYYVGADYSAEMLAAARENGPDVPLVRARLPFLPFEDRSFDAVVSGSTINFVPEIEESLLELFRVSRRYVIFELFCCGGDDPIQTHYYSACGETLLLNLPGLKTVQSMLVNVVTKYPITRNPEYRIMTTNPLMSGFKDIVPLGYNTIYHYFIENRQKTPFIRAGMNADLAGSLRV